MTTIETKIAKNGSTRYYVRENGKLRQISREVDIEIQAENDGQILEGLFAEVPHISEEDENFYTLVTIKNEGKYPRRTGFYTETADKAIALLKLFADKFAGRLMNCEVKALVGNKVVASLHNLSGNNEWHFANQTPETDGSEDDRDNEDAFAFLPTLDELNDINTEPVAHVTFHDTDTKFLPGGQEIQHIRINREQILIVNGETCFITSKKYNARYDAFEKTFYLSTPSYPNYRMRTTEEKFWATMAERGACSFDTSAKVEKIATFAVGKKYCGDVYVIKKVNGKWTGKKVRGYITVTKRTKCYIFCTQNGHRFVYKYKIHRDDSTEYIFDSFGTETCVKACDIDAEPTDPPEDKTALADSLTRAMTIALVNYQTFCRAKNLTAAEDELKLYNICRKALSELWKGRAA